MDTVRLIRYDDLPEDEKVQQPNNGCGREDARYLAIEMDGKTVYRSDAMEPEDARFNRDMSWIRNDLAALITERDALRAVLRQIADHIAAGRLYTATNEIEAALVTDK